MHNINIETGKSIMELPSKSKLSNKHNNNNGVCLTWEDLWVTVSHNKESNNTKNILEDVSGYASPGQVLAIMGPSGSGKSTLLDALAGRLDMNTKQSGQILVNGHKQALSYGTLAYVTQDDALVTTLTLKETVYYSSELQLPATMSKSAKHKRAEECIKEMGLQDAINTRVGGGWGVKGLSGGERRRLSICIEILTQPKLLFLDEPTSGLDSAASYYVMSRILGNERRNGRTIIASIHQPSSQVFRLFDNLCLLSAGRTVYFGPAREANKFFADNGFPCPTLQNPADHFLELINKDFDEDIDIDIEQGSRERKSTEENVNFLVKSYKLSDTYQQVRDTILTSCNKKGEKLETKERNASFSIQCQVLTRRSFVNMYRDLGYYWMRFLVYLVLGFGLGTIYYHLGNTPSSLQAKGWLLMFVSSYLTFMTIGGFPSFVEDMKVFKRERLNGHYGTTSFVVANFLSSMPYLLLISIIPGAITYYLPGLQKNYQNFLYFASVLFSCVMLVESLMMTVASIVPNFLMGIVTGAGVQGLMILGAGFFRLPNDLPKPFWRYPLYYISFTKYAYQGLFKNEFEGLVIHENNQGTIIYGDVLLKDTWQVEMGYSKWVNLAILLGMVLFYRLLFLIIIKATEKLKPVIKAFLMRPPRQVVNAN